MVEASCQNDESVPTVGHSATGRVLVLDDDASVVEALASMLRRAGHEVETATHASDALAKLASFAPDVLVTDVCLPERDGYSVMDAAHALDPLLAVVVMTGFASIHDAVRAMSAGAAHYVAKPVAAEELLAVVDKAVLRHAARRRARVTRRGRPESAPETLIGNSPAMRALLEDLALAAPTSSTVLILGETGTGKKRVAEALHAGSSRAARPFVRVHCASLSETLLESALFGHEKGSFAGAYARREGRFEIAHGGTLFLDEIGEIGPALQAKLLRALQDRTFERVGGRETLTSDVRLIAATQRDLRAMVAAGTFRSDLFYQLNVLTLEVPPLRARRGDLPLLVEYVLGRLGTRLGHAQLTITPEAMRMLEHHPWPGNVRELENALERAAVMAHGATITPTELAPGLAQSAVVRDELAIPGATFAEMERHLILRTYESCGRNVTRAAEILGLSPRTIHYRLREYRGQTGRRQPRGHELSPREPSERDAPRRLARN